LGIWNFYEIVKVAKHLFDHHEMDDVYAMDEATDKGKIRS
jgi:hypothetical protein